MTLENLLLVNFKNYKDSSFNFNSRFNFIYGDNGNGKTNLLEAISMLCYTKSFLQSSEIECVKYGESEFEVSGSFRNSLNSSQKVAYRYSADENRKSVSVNNEVLGRLSSFFGELPLVVLAPGDLKLTQGTPGDRRRNFDIIISLMSHLYFDDLKNYTRIVKQKNSLLRDNLLTKKYSNSKLIDLVEPWNTELIDAGIKLIQRRAGFTTEFQEYMNINFHDIVGDRYQPIISYKPDIYEGFNNGTFDVINIRNRFENKITEFYPLEVKRGMSLVGPHRDNYVFTMLKNGNSFDVRTFASQGEHKTFIVALKFSEYEYLKNKTESEYKGEPILLLDDLYSELDRSRKEKITNLLPKLNQVFLTTTDTGYLELLKQNFKEDELSSFNIINGTQKAAG
ncbi:MAG: DNA replication/repair protein RecF [Ignavibacteriae bacterium]|nr:MAG: DNA replication/repair protein RecF [Ignavibacteriota bacterium]